jgi:hypothetical protein
MTEKVPRRIIQTDKTADLPLLAKGHLALKGGTWRKPKGFVRRRLNRHWESAARKALMKESLKRGGKKSLEFTRPS